MKGPAVTKMLRRSWMPMALAALLAAPVLVADSRDAHAGKRVRVGGSVKVSGHARVRVGNGVKVRRHRHIVRTRTPRFRLRVGGVIRLGGGIYYGARFSEPPPPPVRSCAPPVRAYYHNPPPPPDAPMVVSHPEPQSRFGLGVFAGRVNADGVAGDDLGLLGRLRLSRSVQLEGELAKTEIEDGMRVDRRLGGALLYDLAPHSRLSLHLLGGMGLAKVEMDGGAHTTDHGYAEIGAGLTYRITDRLHLAGDLRAGARTPGEERAPDGVLRSQIAPPEEEGEGYTRGRLGVILNF